MVDSTQFPHGSRYPLLPGVRSRIVPTARLRTHLYEGGEPGAPPVLLIHGNASSARFLEDLVAALAPDWHAVAPDLRGYGASDSLAVDARRGLRDFADDLDALADALGWDRFHVFGWSLGGNVAIQYAIDHPARVRSLTLQSPGSPFGFGATHGATGELNTPDAAGSGAGLINPTLLERYALRDATADSPFSPRSVLRTLYIKPPFRYPPEREDALVEQMLMMTLGERFYPGDSVPSPNWPFVAPGVWGANNALAPLYTDQRALAEIQPQPPILWVRGAADQIVADASLADVGTLGQMGAIPGWPGAADFPPQPMVTQTRTVLDRYRANGGVYEEVVFPDCGHSPHAEHPALFLERFLALLRRAA